MPPAILIHPGWQNSGPAHWQSIWQAALPRAERVIQADWDQPDPLAWVATLNTYLEQHREPVAMVCHSLGCLALVHWAKRYPGKVGRIAAALLVAPADVERSDAPDKISGFAPIPLAPLPFPALVVASDNDPFSRLDRSRHFAAAWGAQLHVLPAAGHINSAAGFGPWPEGRALLNALLNAHLA